MATYKGETIDLTPTEAMAEEAQRFLDWRAEGEKGGTDVAVARARQLVNRQELSPETVRRMHSFFSRHEVDKQAEGFRPGEDGYPSPGRVAWAAWGGDPGQSWARGKDASLDRIDGDERALREELSGAVKEGLQNKVDEHNEKYGDQKGKRVTLRMLSAVFRRGVGAYKTNPGSVRPSVNSPEQWAYARVNAFLQAVRTGKYPSKKFDTDLLPDGHPLKTDVQSDDERGFEMDRHIKKIEETDEDYIITYGKSEMTEPVAMTAGDDEDEDDYSRLDRSSLVFRATDAEMVDEDDRRVRMSLSSEEPVERSFGMEVLRHSDDAVDLGRMNSGHAPLLLDHDMTKQIGVVERTYLDQSARRLRAVVRFGKGALAREIYDDVKDGIRSNVSIGYQIREMEPKNDRDGTVSVSAWVPYEASIVSVPADASVGVNRSATIQPVVKKEVEMTEVNHDEIRAEAAEAAKREFQKTVGEITSLAVKHNRRDLADKAIKDGLSVDQFRGVLLEAIGEGKPLEQNAGAVEMTAKEEREYSFMKAVRGVVNGSGLNGLEREINDEIASRVGRAARGFYAPDSFWSGKRDLTVGTNSAGGFLKPTDHMGNEFVDALRARLVMNDLGTRFMSGLKGDVAIPKLATGVAAGFVAENGATSEVNATFAQVTMSPKSLGAFTDVSRLLMIQSDPSVEQIVRDDLLNSIAQKIEDVAIEGGASNEPTGITGTSGIGSVAIGTNGGAMTWAKVTDLVKEVEVDNAAINANTLAYLTNPKVKSHLASTAKVASTDSVMLLDAPWNSLYGYNMAVTNNVPSDLTKGSGTGLSAMIYGDFSQLMIGFFSTPDVLIDPYTGGSSGAVRIRVIQEVDVAVRHAQSFAACLDINA